MTKKSKKLKNAIEGYKEEIEKHFEKLDKDLEEENDILARYHIKEIDRSLIAALENKINMLGMREEYFTLLKKYKDKLQDYKKKTGIE